MLTVKQYIKHNYINNTSLWQLVALYYNFINFNRKKIRGINNKIQRAGALLHNGSITIAGDNNTIIINSGASLSNVRIFIRGFDHK